MEDYYYMPISKTIFIIWLSISVILTLLSFGSLFILLIIPLCYYFILKNCKYYYNDEKLIIEIGVFNKKQRIVPLYRIVNITAEENIFNFGVIHIKDKQQALLIKYVDHSKNEMLKLVEKWENAKKQNTRNEVI